MDSGGEASEDEKHTNLQRAEEGAEGRGEGASERVEKGTRAERQGVSERELATCLGTGFRRARVG